MYCKNKMKSRFFLLFFVFVFLSLEFLSAGFPTTIIVNTAPNYSVMARVYNPGETLAHLESIYGSADENGVVIMTFEISEDQYELAMWLKDPDTGNYDLRYKRFEEVYITGHDFEINFYPGWYPLDQIENTDNSNETEEISNETEEVLNETINETSSLVDEQINGSLKKEKVTALSISDGTLFSNKRFFYYVGGIIVLVVIIIFFFKYRKYRKNNPREPKQVKVVKLSEMKGQQEQGKNDIPAQIEKIQEAKKMIQEAEEQIKKIQNPNMEKIEAAKKKLIEDQKDLMRLREEAKKE